MKEKKETEDEIVETVLSVRDYTVPQLFRLHKEKSPVGNKAMDSSSSCMD